MAIIKFIGNNRRTLYGQVEYLKDPKKTSSEYSYGFGVNPDFATEDMRTIKLLYHQEDGRQYKQFILSFDSQEQNELATDKLMEIGVKIGHYYSNTYQILMTAHFDTDNLHLHYLINSVNIHTGQKFTSGRLDLHKFKLYINEILKNYNMHLRMYYPEV